MSCNEEEKGTLVLPSAALVPLRKSLVEAINAQRAQTLDLAAKIFEYLKSEAGKEDRKLLSKHLKGNHYNHQEQSLRAAIAEKVMPTPPRRSYGGWGGAEEVGNEQLYSMREEAWRLIVPYVPHGQPRKIQAPKKKDMAPLPAQTWHFSDGECGVSIDPKERTLHWSVGNNNHSVDRAWETVLGQALKKALEKVQWTRGTGGVFNYSSEYSRDAAMEHGYSSVSISKSFGPLGEQEYQHRHGFKPSSLRRPR